MSKRPNIKWTDNQNEQLRKAVRNFNDKIRRLEKKYPDKIGSLPERASIKSLKKIIGTRADLQREIRSLQRFSKRGSETFVHLPPEYGNDKLMLTKWELDDMLRRTPRVNKARRKKYEEIKDIERTSRSTPLGYTRGDEIAMGHIDSNVVKPIVPFSRTMNNKERIMKARTLRLESQLGYWDKRDNILKEAYIKGLYQNYNPEDIREIEEKIRNMPIKDFRKIFESEGGTKTFEWVYPQDRPDSEEQGEGGKHNVSAEHKEYYDYLQALKAIWRVE